MNSKESLEGFCLTISSQFFSFYKILPFLYFIYFYSLFRSTGHLNTHYGFQIRVYIGFLGVQISGSLPGCLFLQLFLGSFLSVYLHTTPMCLLLTCYILVYSFLYYFLSACCFIMRTEKVNLDQIRGRKELGREEEGETVIEIPCMKTIHFY